MTEQDDESAAEEAEQEHDPIAAYVAAIVAEAPPLGVEQRARLRALLRRPDEPAADQRAA